MTGNYPFELNKKAIQEFLQKIKTTPYKLTHLRVCIKNLINQLETKILNTQYLHQILLINNSKIINFNNCKIINYSKITEKQLIFTTAKILSTAKQLTHRGKCQTDIIQKILLQNMNQQYREPANANSISKFQAEFRPIPNNIPQLNIQDEIKNDLKDILKIHEITLDSISQKIQKKLFKAINNYRILEIYTIILTNLQSIAQISCNFITAQNMGYKIKYLYLKSHMMINLKIQECENNQNIKQLLFNIFFQYIIQFIIVISSYIYALTKINRTRACKLKKLIKIRTFLLIQHKLKIIQRIKECLKCLGINQIDVIHQDINQKLQDDQAAAMDARISIVNHDNIFLRKQLLGKNEQFLATKRRTLNKECFQ